MKRIRLKNIEYFDIYTAEILVKLYSEFPCRCRVSCEEITGKVNDMDTMTYYKENDICSDTVRWLFESGYLIYKEDRTLFFDGCVLSAKGLEVLKQSPKSLTPQQGYGEKLVEATGREAKETTRKLVNQLLSTGVDMMIKGVL